MKEVKVTSRALALSEESFSTISCMSLERKVAIFTTTHGTVENLKRVIRQEAWENNVMYELGFLTVDFDCLMSDDE